jgi:ABC-type Mn2+/Zn2+ transport system ATPase subunit
LADTSRPPSRRRDIPLAIDSFEIGAFRGLHDLRLDQLGRINLLVGSNNAGKTSILEALAIFQHAFDPIEWYNTVRAREVRSVGLLSEQMSVLESLQWMFPMPDGDVWSDLVPGPIYLSSKVGFDVDTVRITCEPFSGVIEAKEIRQLVFGRHIPDDEALEDKGLMLRATASLEQGMAGTEHYSREWQIWSQLGIRSSLRSLGRRRNVVFLAPYAHRNSPANLRRLTEASKIGGRDDIDALLRDLDPRIAGVEIITSDDGRYPKIAIRMRTGALMPQGVLGDGIRRALSIALALRTAANGMLLVDEIEAALHVRALDRVFRWLENAAAAFSVQVYATTHSLEAIEAIVRNVDLNARSDLSAYTIDSDRDDGVKRFTGGMLDRLVRQRGLDIRG